MEQLTQASKTPTKSIRIGIVRLSSFGDVVVSASKLMDFYHALAQEYDEVRIEWFVDTRFAGILEHHKAITTLHALPIKRLKSLRAVRELWRSLRALGRFDVVLDLQGLIKSAIVGRALDSREFVGFSFSSAREGLASVLYSRRVKVAYDENILVRNAAIYQCCLRDLALLGGGDSALLKKHRLSPTASLVLRDKAGSLWLSSRPIDTQVLSPCSPLHNPAFSSQILESHSGFTETAENKTTALESTFQQSSHSPTTTPRILEEEKRTENKKVDSSDTPIFATAKTMDCHATATQCLAMTENNAASEKVDSSDEAQNAPTLSDFTKDSSPNTQSIATPQAVGFSKETSPSGERYPLFCDDFWGFQGGGEGIYLSGNEQAPAAESPKSAQNKQSEVSLEKPTPKHAKSGFGWGKAHLPPSTQATLESSTYRVLFVLEASIPQKTYPIEQFAALATRMQQASTQKITFCLIYHEHKHNALSLQAMLEARNLHTCLFPPLDFNALKYVLNAMHCVIGGDTGVTHLAWALQSPQVITLLGNPQTSKGKNMRDTKLSRVLLGNPYVLSQSGSFEIASIPPESIYRVWVDLGARQAQLISI